MTEKDNLAISYSDAGVNIDKGNALIERIKPLASSTKRLGTMSGLGGFGGLFDLKACGYRDPILVSATDGVGTKLKLAFDTNTHHTVGIDLVAMCVNDLIVQGAETLFFLDYFACGALEVDQASNVIAGIAEGCNQAGCQLIGGETAEMPDMYGAGEYDLAGFAVGAVERDTLLPNLDILHAGDVLLGLASSGVHSNGFSLVRKLLHALDLDYTSPSPFGDGSIGEALLTPTKIYVQSCLSSIRHHEIKALAHITGGGIVENIPRILPDHLAAAVDLSSWKMPPVFEWIASTGRVEASEMLRTFNCGIGMVVAVPHNQADKAAKQLAIAGETVFTIGELINRTSHAVITTGTLT